VLFLKQECDLKQNVSELLSLPFHKWNDESKQKITRYGIQSSTTLRNIDAVNNNTYIGKSKIAGKGLFAAKVFEPNEPIGPMFGLRVTEDISARTGMDLDYTFGPEGYKSTKRHFMTSAISPIGKGKNKEKSWIIPAFFCSVAYANDPRLFVDGKPTQKLIDPNVPANSEFIFNLNFDDETGEATFAVSLNAKSRISIDDEICPSYGPNYELHDLKD